MSAQERSFVPVNIRHKPYTSMPTRMTAELAEINGTVKFTRGRWGRRNTIVYEPTQGDPTTIRRYKVRRLLAAAEQELRVLPQGNLSRRPSTQELPALAIRDDYSLSIFDANPDPDGNVKVLLNGPVGYTHWAKVAATGDDMTERATQAFLSASRLIEKGQIRDNNVLLFNT